jgi:DNA polymerase elongation subunit (family B)
MYSSIYFNKSRSTIHLWEYIDGVKVYNKYDAPLYFYKEDKTGEYTSITGEKLKRVECSTYGEYLEKIENLKAMGKKLYETDVPIDAKFIIEHYVGQELQPPKFDIHFLDIEVHSEDGFPSPEKADHPVTIITIWSTKHNKFFIFAEKDFDVTFLREGESCQKFICSEEAALLKEFVTFINNEHPDIISGWNSDGFDIPYLVRRIEKLCGERCVKRLSPVGVVREVEMNVGKGANKKKEKRFIIAGITCLDLLYVYKNYTFAERENYRLGYIAELEINEKKLEYDGSLTDLYRDWQKYTEYNIQDTRLLRLIEDKLGYLSLLFNFCYGCRVPFDQYNKTTRVLDGAFISELSKEGIVLPDVNRDTSDVQYPGGFVKDPDRGVHDWCISIDATSLYPSIMMNWNISPETKVAVLNKKYVEFTTQAWRGVCEDDDVVFPYKGKAHGKSIAEVIAYIHQKSLKDVNKEDGGIHGLFNDDAVHNIVKALQGEEYENLGVCLNYDETDVNGVVDYIKKNNLCLSGNGVLYRQDKVGVIPKFVKVWFDKRKEYKKKMIEAEKAGDKAKKKYYDLLQLNYKILINSVYGYLGTCHSRFYDFDNAVSVTINGQNIIKDASGSIDDFFRNKWETHFMGAKLKAKNFEGVIIYNDTDSVYINGGKIINSISAVDMESYKIEQVKNFIIFGKPFMNSDIYDLKEEKGKKVYKIKEQYKNLEDEAKSIQNIIQTLVTNAMVTLTTKKFNCKENKIFFKREAVSRRAAFLQRKRYVAWVLNNEGVECDKMKCVGVEIVRSSTPLFIQDVLEDVVFDMLKYKSNELSNEKVKEIREKFYSAQIEQISFPRGIHGMDKYEEPHDVPLEDATEDGFIYTNHEGKKIVSSQPIHVRASLLYNNLISSNEKLRTKYTLIKNDSKLKFVYMKPSATFRSNVLAFVDKWPKELELDANVDKDLQFEKTFIAPMTQFYNIFGWTMPNLKNVDISDLFVY